MSTATPKPALLQGLNWIQTGTDHPETVVLIHAVAHDLTYWDRQIEALSPDYNVVALDLPGHGRSTGDPSLWSFDYAASVIAALIEHVSDKPIHLVGISFGSFIAEVTTLTRPDLIRSLTLIGSASSFPEETRKIMRARGELVSAQGMSAVVDTSLQRRLTPSTRERRPDLVDRLTKTILADDPATHAAIWKIIPELNLDARLPEIKCPALVLVGEQDPSTPPSTSRYLASAIPNAKLVIIPNASHIVTVEAPAAVNEALRDFLAEASK